MSHPSLCGVKDPGCNLKTQNLRGKEVWGRERESQQRRGQDERRVRERKGAGELKRDGHAERRRYKERTEQAKQR